MSDYAPPTEGVTTPPDKPEKVGTGAGEGATGQDTGTAWVTRSEDCPEAPAQAHLLGPDGFTRLDGDADTLAALEMARKAAIAERRAGEAEYHIEQLRDARDSAERRIERAERLIDSWEHDAPDHSNPVFIGRLRECLRHRPAPNECSGLCGEHHWLDRPESDTRVCLICDTEVTG